MSDKKLSSPRIKIIQKIYAALINPDEIIEFPKSHYRKYIKDVVNGTLERREFIEETLQKYLQKDINLKRTDKLLKVVIYAAVYELSFKHNNPIKVIIYEYLKAAEFFLEKTQIKYLNAVLDKISKKIRNIGNN